MASRWRTSPRDGWATACRPRGRDGSAPASRTATTTTSTNSWPNRVYPIEPRGQMTYYLPPSPLLRLGYSGVNSRNVRWGWVAEMNGCAAGCAHLLEKSACSFTHDRGEQGKAFLPLCFVCTSRYFSSFQGAYKQQKFRAREGKPAARQGSKAHGPLEEVAGLPKEAPRCIG